LGPEKKINFQPFDKMAGAWECRISHTFIFIFFKSYVFLLLGYHHLVIYYLSWSFVFVKELGISFMGCHEAWGIFTTEIEFRQVQRCTYFFFVSNKHRSKPFLQVILKWCFFFAWKLHLPNLFFIFDTTSLEK
jgi:hypothetical protein